MTATRFFPSGAALQDYLLAHAGPGALVVVPHQRLAHQVWHRQRLAALAAGRPAWEPLALFTLNAWWSELFKGLWPPAALAPALVRLALWRQALADRPAAVRPHPGAGLGPGLGRDPHPPVPLLDGGRGRPPHGWRG